MCKLFFFFATISMPLIAESQDFWQKLDLPGSPNWSNVVAAGVNGEVIANGGTSVYYSTNDGVTWDESIPDPTNTNIIALAIHPNGDVFAGTYSIDPYVGRLLRSTDQGATWINAGFPDASFSAITVDGNGHVLAGSAYSGVYRSTDVGQTWHQIWATNRWVLSIAVGSDSGILAGTVDSGFYRSTDDGVSWNIGNAGIPWTAPRILDIVKTSDGVLLAAVDSISPLNGTLVKGGVFRSMDHGVSWVSKSNGLTDPRVASITVDSSGELYAGTWGGGVFHSTDDGSTWTAHGLSGLVVLSMATSTAGYVYAATDSGLFRSLQPTVGIEGDTRVPVSFALEQNYPNPFNPTTTIRYNLPGRVHVSLKIYDVMGREIDVLVNGVKGAGRYTTDWNADNMSNGIYLIRLEAGDFSQTKKMVLMK